MVYENRYIYIEVEESEVPWLKIFAKKKCKEMSDCDEVTKKMIFKALEIIEKEMLDYFKPDKINIASFGNYVPQVHWHIQARFQNDSFFPEPLWGKRQREGNVQLSPMEDFIKRIRGQLDAL
ncbi:HIT family protein [Nitratiruptor sp. SB155-2]|uniref:HIT family protein n=1 Tax=Nitratiruptor sp. (strain SB155-2) TaxID=387092 RepID=UPI00030DFE26|nr:HIT family protein [Nitratiruptor sp. SB155-2]